MQSPAHLHPIHVLRLRQSTYEGAALVQVRVVRIFNTYGPRMALDDGRVVSNFVAQALTDQDLTVYGDGLQTRSFQYVSDLIKGMSSELVLCDCQSIAVGVSFMPGWTQPVRPCCA